MGFLSGLLDKVVEKKHCDICGNETGRIFGNNKIVDGNMCDECVAKLSPFFRNRSKSTLADIYGQLQYRKENEARLESFQPSRTLGGDSSWKVVLDESARCFIVTSSSNWRSANPDIISFEQFDGCEVRIDEDKSELFDKDDEGKRVSYDPPRYEYSYDFYVTIHVNTPYFETVSFKVNGSGIDRKYSEEYTAAEVAMHTVKNALEAAASGKPEVEFVPERPVFSRLSAAAGRPEAAPARSGGRSLRPEESEEDSKKVFGGIGDRFKAPEEQGGAKRVFGDLKDFGKK